MEEKFKFEDEKVFLIKNKSYVLNKCPTDEENMLKHIELCGRICYKSEDKITEDSYKKFFNLIMNKNHLSVIEHSNVLFSVKFNNETTAGLFLEVLKKYAEQFGQSSYFISGYNSYKQNTEVVVSANLRAYFEFLGNLCHLITTKKMTYDTDIYFLASILIKVLVSNFRFVLDVFKDRNEYIRVVANNILSEHSKGHLIHIPSFNPDPITVIPTDDVDNYSCVYNDIDYSKNLHVYTAKFITNRGISHEIARTRTFSISQESTRYVNYSKKNEFYYTDIFNNSEVVNTEDMGEYVLFLENTSKYYNYLNGKLSPQFSRNVLPHSTKTEMVCSGRWGQNYIYMEDSSTSEKTALHPLTGWAQFLKMRSSITAHPEVRELCLPLITYFKNISYL